ncbi:nucleotidyltransferase family protein [Frigoribacterium sp. CFBP9039]|uniref:nucleotidyltransferase family protein n=1 Tax=Frigoribacterium sp. CFBP9029 TaxID=3096541 RepID=UPI002A6ADA56|nr:nucleotidyltransferase family protein [Frigoribacterium sp. CFBP9039]MDY0946874.1 nucleotidyltransferase family protein [Frigoribacterium sp. CFBP9039]
MARARPGPIVGLLLAAGAGSRMGGPKALVADARGPWLTRGVANLLAGGCDRVVVVLGAGATEAEDLLAGDPRLLGSQVSTVVADDWADGLSASLRAGLRALGADPDLQEARVALITLVDYPGLPASAVARLLSVTGTPAGAGSPVGAGSPLGASTLRRSVFGGRPGHPVVVGRAHWSDLAQSISGDQGAGAYLRENGALEVDCRDLWSGHDVDSPRAASR